MSGPAETVPAASDTPAALAASASAEGPPRVPQAAAARRVPAAAAPWEAAAAKGTAAGPVGPTHTRRLAGHMAAPVGAPAFEPGPSPLAQTRLGQAVHSVQTKRSLPALHRTGKRCSKLGSIDSIALPQPCPPCPGSSQTPSPPPSKNGTKQQKDSSINS